jgi:hypothetical protein
MWAFSKPRLGDISKQRIENGWILLEDSSTNTCD